MRLLWLAIPVVLSIVALLLATSDEDNYTQLFLVETKKSDTGKDHNKIAPALSVTKTFNGVLKGADSKGRAVIAFSPDRVDQIKTDPAVGSITKDIPNEWKAVSELKLSYFGNNKVTPSELEQMGLKLIEDYDKGSFMIVKPISGEINEKLIKALETNDKVRYVAPIVKLKAIQSETP